MSTAPRPPTVRELLLTATLAGVATLPVWRSAWLHFGATEAELDATLPGDDLVEDANLVATRAVTIGAPPDEVWRWVVQLGADRGGFYSYDALENLVGSPVRSADRVEERWQHLTPGDRIALHPAVSLTVSVATPAQALVLVGPSAPAGPAAPYDFSWAFVLRRARHGRTRLVVRERYGYRTGWSALVAEPTALVSFVMTEAMMRGIRARAEHRRSTVRPA